MATVKQRDLPQDPMARKIVKRLADLTYSRRPDEVYSDFLHLTEIYLRRLPINVLHVVQHGTMPADDGEDTETWRRIAKKYKKDQFKVFAEATHMLIDACDPTITHPYYHDLLGDIYMFWGWPDRAKGQYFTPYDLAFMMAKMTLEADADKLCRKAVADAIDKSIYHEVWGASGASMTMPGKEDLMLFMLPMVYQHLQPVLIQEPCIGSGVMMLAAAAVCPRWAVDSAVVQFWGSDIDPDCVLMSKVNFMLYGLNGYFARLTAAAMGIAPDGAIVEKHVRVADALKNQPPIKLPKNVPTSPAPVIEPLPLAASPAVKPKQKKTTATFTLQPHNQLTQLTVFDMLKQLDEEPKRGKRKGKGGKQPPSNPLLPTPPAM